MKIKRKFSRTSLRCTGKDRTKYNHPVPFSVFNYYTMKEVLSDDFLHTFYPFIKEYTGNNILSIFNRFVQSGELKRISREESEYILERVIDALISDNVSGYSFDSIIGLLKSISGKNLEHDYLVGKLFEKEFFKKLKISTDYVSSFLDEVMSYGKFADAVEMINLIQSQIPDYRSFPLIIMNENITSEEKIKALKLVYKQKDFPQYKLYFRTNLKDLNDLDSFIEATIIQNNRVKEKDDNLIKLFKDIFVSGDWHSNSNISEKPLKNKVSFSKKYSEKFSDPKFVKKFYDRNVGSMSTNKWERKNQYSDFLKLIFSGVDVLKQIEVMKNCPELKPLGESFSNKFRTALTLKDDVLCEALLKVFSAWSKDDPEVLIKEVGRDNFKETLERYGKTDALDAYFNNFRLVDYKKRNITLQDHGTAQMIMPFISEGLINKVTLLEEDDLDCLGFNYEKTKIKLGEKDKWGYSRTSTYSIFPNIETAMFEFISCLRTKLNDASTDCCKIIIDKFFKRFEDSDKTEFLTENFMNINGDDATKDVKSWNINRKSIDMAMDVLNQFKTLAMSYYAQVATVDSSYEERQSIFTENIEEAENTLKIVCLAI